MDVSVQPAVKVRQICPSFEYFSNSFLTTLYHLLIIQINLHSELVIKQQVGS